MSYLFSCPYLHGIGKSWHVCMYATWTPQNPFFTFWNKSCHCIPELQLSGQSYTDTEVRWDKVDHHALQWLQKTSNQMKMDFLRFIVTTQLIMHDRDSYWAHFTRTPLSNWTNRVIVPLPEVGQLLSGEQISVWQARIASWLHPSLDRQMWLLKLFRLN